MPLVRVRGRSMMPTLRPGDLLWIAKARDVKRGDIVLINKNGLLLKRVVGLPGEMVSVRSSRVHVNNNPLNEPYVPPTASLQPSPNQSLPLEPSAYFVLGDARDDSMDSRRIGPVNIQEIEGVASRRLWPPTRWGRLAVMFLALAAAASGFTSAAATAPVRLLAFASESGLALMIGKYKPGHGWVPSTHFYEPPAPGDVFTLYGTLGKVGEVAITDSQSAYHGGTFAGWSAKLSHWDNKAVPYALAVSGAADLAAAHLEPMPLDNPEYRGIVARYLKYRGLHVEEPFLTQAYRWPNEVQGVDAALLVAHSDASTLMDHRAADVYAVALLWWNDHGKEKIFPLASQTFHKPASQTIEEFQKYHGTRDFLRVICAVDIAGDGFKEIGLYRARTDSTRIDLFRFNGRGLRLVLSAEKMSYN